MENVKLTVTRLLADLGARVFYFYPDSLNELPAISFFEAQNQAIAFADDKPYLFGASLVIEVWDRTGAGCAALSDLIIERLSSNGFTFASVEDVGGETKVVHRRMTFRIIGG